MRSQTHNIVYFKTLYQWLNKQKVNILKYLDDETFAKVKYKENTGLNLNLDNPMLFNEKLWWLKINNRTELLTQCSDKIAVRIT